MSRIISNRSLITGTSGRLKMLTTRSFAAGVISVGAAGIFTPDEYTDEVSAAALSTNTGGNAAIIGYRWFQQSVLSTRPFVPGSAEVATAYVLGFNLAYFAAVGIRNTLD